MLSEYDQRSLQLHSAHNRSALDQCDRCGCFYCLSIFNPKEIREWTDQRFDGTEPDDGTTAICPKCGVDSVIADSASSLFGDELLKEMKIFWFEK